MSLRCIVLPPFSLTIQSTTTTTSTSTKRKNLIPLPISNTVGGSLHIHNRYFFLPHAAFLSAAENPIETTKIGEIIIRLKGVDTTTMSEDERTETTGSESASVEEATPTACEPPSEPEIENVTEKETAIQNNDTEIIAKEGDTLEDDSETDTTKEPAIEFHSEADATKGHVQEEESKIDASKESVMEEDDSETDTTKNGPVPDGYDKGAAEETPEHTGSETIAKEDDLTRDDSEGVKKNESAEPKVADSPDVNDGGAEKTEFQPQNGRMEEEKCIPAEEDSESISESPSDSSYSDITSSSESLDKDDEFCLIFNDFLDLQTKLVLMPFIDEEGKGAVVASYSQDSKFEGLVMTYLNGIEVLQTADFTDLLAALREATTPIKVKFGEASPRSQKHPDQTETDEEEESMMEEVDLCREANDIAVHEEKKDDGDEALRKQADLSTSMATPKTGNHQNDTRQIGGDAECLETENLLQPTKGEVEASSSSAPESRTTTTEPSSSTPSSYLEKRQNKPSKEHTRAISLALDDHHNHKDTSSAATNNLNTKLSSGMFALSAWGMRMKAQSEKLLATTGEAIAAQQKKQQQQQQQQSAQKSPAEAPDKKASNPKQQPQQQGCDMYLQTNLGAYFPISRGTTRQSIKTQHLQAVTTSSLFCIRKSATQACIVGRDDHMRYSFQWYHSLSTTRSRNLPLPPLNYYGKTNQIDPDESIGDSTRASRRTHSSTESVSSYCSSSSSSSLFTCSSYSMSTAGVTHHTISVASNTTNNMTAAAQAAKESSQSKTKWLALKGATAPTFQPNTTLVGKRLRCIVTIRPVRSSLQDETDDENSLASPQQQPSSKLFTSHGRPGRKDSSSSLSSQDSSNASAIMEADDEINTNDISLLGDEENDDDMNRNVDEGVEKIICDSVIPIQADMVLFNGAKQAMQNRGIAKFGNLIGRSGLEGSKNTTPATATLACGKTFRIEVGTVRKTITCDSLNGSNSSLSLAQLSQNQQTKQPSKQHLSRRSLTMNSVQIYCRSLPHEEFVSLTDIPLLQVTARASPTNSKHVDLLFPAVPPSGEEASRTILEFLSDYCVVDHPSCAETGGIPRLELEAPNRMTRESFLLALGIANYQGKASHLDNKKVLYWDNAAAEACSESARVPMQQKHPNTTDSNLSHASTSPLPVSKDENGEEPKKTTSSPGTQTDTDTNFMTMPSDGIGHRRQPISDDLVPCPNVIGDADNVVSRQSNVSHNSSSINEINPNSQVVEESSTHGTVLQVFKVPPVVDDSARVRELQHEIELLRAQLTRKDKIVTDLERQVKSSEISHQQTREALAGARHDLKDSQDDCERIQISKRHVERSMQSQHEATQKLESDHKVAMDDLREQISKKNEKISEMEKLNRALQNEKAVLGATVEARESKLVKLEELQASNTELSEKVAQQETFRLQLEESHRRYEKLQHDFGSKAAAESECRKELDSALETIKNMKSRIQGEQEKASSCQSRLEAIQKVNQQLKGERNNFKQKNESLSKEVARLCRGGRNMRDIEKILSDHESLLQETELLRVQKRKALEEAHQYRTSYEQVRAAEEMSSGMDDRETRRVLERTKELERLLSEMTDYVSAKEMQLETMRQVNETLQEEIHNLAQANLRRDEV